MKGVLDSSRGIGMVRGVGGGLGECGRDGFAVVGRPPRSILRLGSG